MDGAGPRRVWRIYREVYASERAEREARGRERPESAARTGFWTTLGLAWVLNLVDAVLDPDGVAWQGLRFVVGVLFIAFAVCFVFEVLSRRRAQRARG